MFQPARDAWPNHIRQTDGKLAGIAMAALRRATGLLGLAIARLHVEAGTGASPAPPQRVIVPISADFPHFDRPNTTSPIPIGRL